MKLSCIITVNNMEIREEHTFQMSQFCSLLLAELYCFDNLVDFIELMTAHGFFPFLVELENVQ